MNTFILFWNPAISSYKLEDYKRELIEGDDAWMNWSVWEHEKAQEGDRFFMVRCGEGNIGICMSGYFTSEPYQDDDWSGRGRVTYYMNMEPDVMIDSECLPILPAAELANAIPIFDWFGGHSGRLLAHQQAKQLEKLWSNFLKVQGDKLIPHVLRRDVKLEKE